MELKSIQHYFQGKTILVSGATSFLEKVSVEKLLRIQSELKKLYLLLRASDADAATRLLHDEIIGKDLFKTLRDKWGEDFDSLIVEKVVAVAGDVSVVNLGLKDVNLEKKMLEEIDVIVNFAATTKFDERFDIAMGVNTMGTLHVLNFAKSCHKINVLLHVSTAYVCSEIKDREVIREKSFEIGQTLKGASKLNIYAENNLVEKKIDELQAKNTSGKATTSAMKDYGIKRANLYGWPNTYVFTKAMGEMLLTYHKDKIPLIIIRPTMVTSTYKEPFPGWIEGLRTMDAVIGGYGKGKVTCFLGHPESILDLIPADMVINCMMRAIVTHSKQASEEFIYHVGSSLRNPFKITFLHDILYLYFKNNPWTNKSGKPVIISKATLLTSLESFHGYMRIRYVLPLKVLYLVNKVLCEIYQDFYSVNNKKVEIVMRLAALYKPYVFFKAVFDDTNTEKLRMATKMEDVGFHDFEFDPKGIDWTEYMMNVHIPGLVKYVMNSSPK